MFIHESIDCIDTHYGGPEKTAVYLLVQDGRAAFIDTNTTLAAPRLLAALDARGIPRESVDYLIVTHVHLDHAGGTAALLAACPNATVLAHPKTTRHLAAPERLVAASKAIYGEEQFAQLYGEILPVPADCILSLEDNTSLVWCGRRLFFFHTPGHASHHFCIYDEATETVFAGDTFGIGRSSIMRPGTPFLVCSTSPSDFDAHAARESIKRILDTGARQVCVGHYGVFHDLERAHAQLLRALSLHEGIMFAAADSNLSGAELQDFCIHSVEKTMQSFLQWCGVDDVVADLAWIGGDIALNGMGLAIAAERQRKRDTKGAAPNLAQSS